MKKIFSMMIALATMFTVANAQTVEGSKVYENFYVSFYGGVTAIQNPSNSNVQLFTFNVKDRQIAGYPVGGMEIGKYITPVVGFSVEGLAKFGTTTTNTVVSQSNVVGNLKFNLSNLFGGYPGQPRRVEVVFVPGLGWGHDYGDVYYDRNYLTYNLGAELNFNLGKKRAWQINVKPEVVWNNYNNVLMPNVNNLEARVLLGLTYKFGSKGYKAAKSNNFVLCPYSVTANDYNSLAQRVSELENRKPVVDTVTVVKEVYLEKVVEKAVPSSNVTVYFDKGKYVVSDRELAHLEYYASKADKSKHIVITGSADSGTGSLARNKFLAEQRALAVKRLLVEKYGFNPNNISLEFVVDAFDKPHTSRVSVVE